MTEETGTLAELNVKPGDVVECVGWSDDDSDLAVGQQYTIMEKHPLGHYNGLCAVRDRGWTPVDEVDPTMLFRIVSRTSATHKTWGEMTDAEKGAILLADCCGEVVEWRDPGDINDDWDTKNIRFGCPDMAYRVRPPEPKRETVTLSGWWIGAKYFAASTGGRLANDTHRITLPLLDGNIPAGTYTSEAGETIIVEEL